MMYTHPLSPEDHSVHDLWPSTTNNYPEKQSLTPSESSDWPVLGTECLDFYQQLPLCITGEKRNLRSTEVISKGLPPTPTQWSEENNVACYPETPFGQNFPLFAAGEDCRADLLYFDMISGWPGCVRDASPATVNNSIEDADNIQANCPSIIQDNFLYTAERLVRGVRSNDAIVSTINQICAMLKPFGSHKRKIAEDKIRLAIMHRFAQVWHPISEDRFLTFAEYDDFLKNGLELTLPGQKQRMETTKQGMAYIEFMGRLLDAKILSGCDIALAAETLLQQCQKHGFMRALYRLVRTAGDKVCRKDSRERIKKIMDALYKTSDEVRNIYEFKLFCRPILALLEEYMRIQKMKTHQSRSRKVKTVD